jgi:hypothetical protein
MRYADRDAVLRQLKIVDSTQVERVELLENGLAEVLDGKLGRSFGTTPVAETRTAYGYSSDLLILPAPITSVTSVTIDGVALDVASYQLWFTDAAGSRGILLGAGYWWGPVAVNGIWADQTAGVPADIREVMTFLTVDEYRVRVSSPAGQIGPDGLIIPVRNPWKYEVVQATIDRYRLATEVVV